MSFDLVAILVVLAVPLIAGTALIVDAVRRAVAEARPGPHPGYHLKRSANPSRFRELGREITIEVRNRRTAF
jgi:hypothetical protein